jgi:hypothetical protein
MTGQQVCPDCGTVILDSQPVVNVDGRWRHAACRNGHVPMIGPASGALRKSMTLH